MDSPPFELESLEFSLSSPLSTETAEIADYARFSFAPRRPILAGALDLMARIYRDFEYAPGTTSSATPTRDVFRLRRGVCQDFAHLMLGMLRSLGLSARYVSG